MKTLVYPLYQFDMQSLGGARDGQVTDTRLSVFRDPARLRDMFRSLESAMAQACQIYKIVSASSSLDYNYQSAERSKKVGKLLDKLQFTVQKIPAFSLGETSLVWVCYIATTNSTQSRHRTFFASRLAELLRQIGHDNVKDMLAQMTIT